MRVAGFGFRQAATVDSLTDALAQAGGAVGLAALAAPADKAAAQCLAGLAARLGLPIQPVPADRLRAIDTPTQAARVLAARGTGSVAEAAALSAAGPGARLLSSRQISTDRMASCAIATGDTP
ncbi:cobalamin biosynthesis protein [Rhodovulum adriaticum]|uniref:Cobalt-precorrin 5A hydrolase n=1 Tax=Rhodovulum adriaticum TaxID=35804 RepID=A0A4R2NNF6_RHOAD|nr:cobalamin biosynthesis protein [Rhodovulum adriaticum]MBK1637080.1 precorrin methylase [Rhodovulum adriaticum]TCP22814.1 cobalt-precorrin 5A hydrolase [Rhodovulum adriaticum]